MTYTWESTYSSTTTRYYRTVTLESPYEMFAYWSSTLSGTMYFYMGAIVDGVCQRITNDNPCDTVCLGGLGTNTKISTNKVISTISFDSGDSLIQTAYFRADSEDDYSCSGYVFNSLEAAQSYYSDGDISGVIQFSPTVKFPIKQLGYLDETQTFIINAKLSDSNRMFKAQIVDELTIVDLSEVGTAILNFGSTEIDITNTINEKEGTVIVPLNKKLLSTTGDIECEIVLKDVNGVNILTTNTFIVRIKDMKGGCNC